MKSFYILFTFSFLLASFSLSGQMIKGKIINNTSEENLSGVDININGNHYTTNGDGSFEIDNQFQDESLNIEFNLYGFENIDLVVDNSVNKNHELGILFMRTNSTTINSENLYREEQLSQIGSADDDVSSLLAASWDPFGSQANYNFSITRFNPRGLDNSHSKIYLNNLPFNNLNDGRYFWSLWGGLNDVLRSRYSQHGLNTTDFSLGGFNGATDIDLRASSQRKGTRVTTSLSNRSYSYRTMITHNSGQTKSGWAYSLSASRRWGSGGYIEGTYYDAYSYFVSIDKKINESNSLNLVAFAAPSVRGRSSSTTQFVYDLVGDNFYNPNLGMQNGKLRNSREYRTHQPVIILRHDFKLGNKTSITTNLGTQFGKFGSTRLGWLEAGDPRPDYYGNLPYDNIANLSPSDLQRLTEEFQNNPSLQQIDFDNLIEINRNRDYSFPNSAGELQSENVSAYVIEEQRFENTRFSFQSNLNQQINSDVSLQAGITAQYDRNHNYKVLDDLLGGEYYLDVDGFALRDSADNRFIQNNIDLPNRLLKEGDVFGYDYYIHNRKVGLWSNINVKKPKIDYNIGFSIDRSSFWRSSEIANGKFPENSKGESEKASFTSGSVKAGATYKINGRNYVYANASYMTRAPFSRNGFLSSETRNDIIPGLINENIYGGEIGYIIRHPKFNVRATAFYNQSEDAIQSTLFYFDGFDSAQGQFVNQIQSGIDKIHYGFEFGIYYQLSSVLELGFASAVGEYYISSRPELSFNVVNSGANALDTESTTSYLKGFNVSGIPQIANSMSLSYRNPNYWSVSLTANYFDNNYIDVSPARRTIELPGVVEGLTDVRGYEGLNSVDFLSDLTDQEEFDSIFSMDLFARKSWRIKSYGIALMLGVNNVLDKTNIRSGGFEQLRFDNVNLDENRWAPRYFYAYGRTYSFNATFSF